MLLVAAVAAALPALLSACQPGQTGAAALVGNDRLSESKVQDEAKATITAIGPSASAGIDPGTILDATVARFVHHELLARAAAQVGATVTQNEVDALLAPAIATAGSRAALEQQAAQQASVPPAELDDYARDVVLETKVEPKLLPNGTAAQQQAALLALYAKLAKQDRVTVSPRYGTYDVASLSVVPGTNDLSAPLGSPSPSASASP
jgi:hypothetical protein